jgi:UDP-3-O-[3-hydroxymyristoyl] glucosamine N-acyltransferase
MKRTVQNVAKFIGAQVIGDGSVELHRIASIESATAGDLVYVEDEKHFELALKSRAAAVICAAFGQRKAAKKPLIVSDQPKLGFARAAGMLHPNPEPRPGVHPTAVVDSSAVIGKNVGVDALAVLGDGVQIGEGSRIGAGVVIATGVKVGRHCKIYPRVCIYSDVTLGDRVIVHAGAVLGSDGFGYVREEKSGRYEKFPQVGRLEIGDDVEIGANTTIDRGALDVTRIGSGAKIDNLVHIGHNCQIGENVVIAAQTGLSGSIAIEDGAVLGGQVGIGEHARIGEGVLLGGQAGVLPHKILKGKGVAFWGTPAKPLKKYLKELATVGKLASK